MSRIGIDLGGTKTEVATLDDNGTIVRRERCPTPGGYADIIATLVELVTLFESEPSTPVGIGMPGIISPATGLVKNANTVCLNGQPLARDVIARLGPRVRFENDANCMILSEVNGGAAAGAEPAFGVIIGTGTGGALYANGGLVRGANAIAGEWGHNPVPWHVPGPSARSCYCGRENCVETFLSGAGLQQSFSAAGGDGTSTVEDIAAAALADAPVAAATLEGYARQLAACLALVVNIVDPAAVVLAGGLSNLPGLAPRVTAALQALAFSDTLVTTVQVAHFGDSSGVRGAAMLWRCGERVEL